MNVIPLHASTVRRDFAAIGIKPIDATPWTAECDHEAELRRICAAHGLTFKVSCVWTERPVLRQAVLRLSAYVTPLFPGRIGTLLEEVVVGGMRAFETQARIAGPERAHLAFLERLADAALPLMATQVVAVDSADGTVRHWNVWNHTLPQWLTAGRHASFYLRKRESLLPYETAGARMALASRLVSHRELGLLVPRSDLT